MVTDELLTFFFFILTGFNPRWDEDVSFVLSQPDLAVVRFVVYDQDRYVDDFIGYFALPFHSIQEGNLTFHLISSPCKMYLRIQFFLAQKNIYLVYKKSW